MFLALAAASFAAAPASPAASVPPASVPSATVPPVAVPPVTVPLATVVPFGFIRPSWSHIQNDDASPADQDGFSLQARLGARATAEPLHLQAAVEADLIPEFSLKDAWISATPVPWVTVAAGQQKVPVSVGLLASDTRRLLPNPPRMLSTVGFPRDLGVRADVRLPWAGEVRGVVSGGVFDGEGSNRIQNVNEHYLYAVRGLATPLGERTQVFEGGDGDLYVGLGGGWVYNLTGEEVSAEEHNTFAGELQAAWGRFSLQGEVLRKEVFHANPDVPDYDVVGGYGQIGVFFGSIRDPGDRHVEVVERVEWSDPHTAVDSTGLTGAGFGAVPTYQAAWVLTAGVNFYLSESARGFHDRKLQVAYSHAEETEGADVADDLLVTTATFRF